MKRNGFTLIELLGVIIVLSLLVILVFPSITNSVKNSSTKTDDLTKEMIYKAADLYISNNSDKFLKIDDNKYSIELQDLIDEGHLASPIKLSDSDNIINEKCVQVVYNNGFKYELKDSGTCTEHYMCSLNDVDKDKTFDVGEEVTCGTESFYVISDDGDAIQMLAKYRLNKESGLQSTEEETKKENEVYVYGEATAFTAEQIAIISKNSVRCFSSELYWLDENEKILSKYRTDGLVDNYYVFDKSKLKAASTEKCTEYVADYVVAYEKTLKEKVGVATANATLMSYEQAIELGCKGYIDGDGDDYNCSGAPDWVKSTTYWLGTYRKLITDVSQIHRIWSIDYDNSFDLPKYQEDVPYHGVRPVIKILKNEINVS